MTTGFTATVGSSYTAKGEVWQCIVTPNDGYSSGDSDDDEVTVINTPPSVDSVDITPDPAFTDTDLAADPSGWTDADGDPEGYQWQWQKYVDGSWQDIDSADSDMLDSSNFFKDDQIQVICIPYDGDDTGPPVEATGAPVDDNITISNTPPTAPVIDVTPDIPLVDNDLLCTITGTSSDIDGDGVIYFYTWFKDGESQEDLDDMTTVSAGHTSVDEVWRCVVTPNDGTDNGTTAEDEVTVISNNPPSVDEVDISPDPAYTDTDLTADPSGWFDADGDPEGYLWQWQMYGGGWQDIDGADSDTLDSTHFIKGDQIQVICTPYDGDDTGDSVTDNKP